MKELRHHPTILEESSESEPQSNVFAERCAQTLTGLFWTTRSALETRIGSTTQDDHPVLTWLVKHAASHT